jgi:hypothetical protein
LTLHRRTDEIGVTLRVRGLVQIVALQTIAAPWYALVVSVSLLLSQEEGANQKLRPRRLNRPPIQTEAQMIIRASASASTSTASHLPTFRSKYLAPASAS